MGRFTLDDLNTKPWVLGNWKMNHTISEAKAFFEAVSRGPFSKVFAGVAPSACVLGAFYGKKLPLQLGAQNIYYEEKGAFTGELSAKMVEEVATFALVGHSERRAIFNETDEMVSKKAKVAIKQGILPVICVGETLDEREAGQAFEVVERQVQAAIAGIEDQFFLIAYEPVWAIGTGKTATPEDAQSIHAHIAKLLPQKRPILYGGSVKPDNISELLSQPDINGALVGGASLKPESFLQLLQGAVL